MLTNFGGDFIKSFASFIIEYLADYLQTLRTKYILRDFLDKYSTTMPRTALRYAIEKLEEKEKKEYMKK